MTITDNYYNCTDCYACHLNDVCKNSLLLKKTVVKHKTDEQLSLF